jgi:uncharacterized membrane protein
MQGTKPVAPEPDRLDHIEETIRVSAKLQADHHEAATRSQLFIQRLVAVLARPFFIALLLSAALLWAGGNLLAVAGGHPAIDPPPFAWMELAVSLAALCLTALILSTQRHDDVLAQRRQQMTLELAILGEQKLAKIIQLLEESRRDNPLLGNRIDPSADAMSIPTDPHALSETIDRSSAEEASSG